MESGGVVAILVASVLAGMLALGSWLGLVGQRAHRRAWQEAANACGLEGVKVAARSLTGRTGPFEVRLSRYGDSSEDGTRISVSGLPTTFAVRPQGPGADLQGLRGVTEVVLGDDMFDRAAWVRGQPVLVRAILDHGNRKALGDLLAGTLERPGASVFAVNGRVEEGTLVVEAPESVIKPPSPDETTSFRVVSLHLMPDLLEAVLGLARRLLPPDDLVRSLAENIAAEPLAEVRLRTLGTLLDEFPDHPATRAILVEARDDPDAAVRVCAGIALGEEGRNVLLHAARGHGADDATTARAVAALGRDLTVKEATALLHGALRTRREGTARACMGVLGGRGGPEAAATLARVLAVEKGTLAEAAAENLAETGDVEVEAPLLRALAEAPPPVQEAAARALGRVGTAAAVAPLRQAEGGHRGLRAAAREAIADIQARLTGTAGASAGQLSLSAGESGQVSLVDDASGRVSLPTTTRPGEPEPDPQP